MRWSLRRFPVLIGVLALALTGLVPVHAEAQVQGTPFVPYYGKNHVRYTTFKWQIYTTDHFTIFFYPALKPHLERIASYAESAYQHDSSELKHDLPFKVSLIIFKTESEFQQENVSGEEMPEGVLAFAEPYRNRMLLPIDAPPDELYQTITHELTHIFEFDIIPRGLVTSGLPLWVDEGLADYMTGYWNPLDLMAVRDAAISDNVPAMSHLESEPLAGRTPYELGHACFEFIEAKWGKDGLRQFLFSLRKSVIGGGASAYEEAFKLKPQEFDEQFERYLKERFKPFRDKELPADYGRNIAPSPQHTPYVSVVSIEPSPTGDIIAAVVGNIHDYELDIILISAKDGQVIRNLTKGFDKDMGFDYIAATGGLRGNSVPWIGWAPVGDRLAYFVRKNQKRTLIIQNVVTGRIEDRIAINDVDAPESPAFSPDGRKVAFAATQNAIPDIFILNLDTRQLTNVTKDDFGDYSPSFSPDGKTLVYSARVSGNHKLFQVDLGSGLKRQLTFGTHDDLGAKFLDDHTLVFTSTATDPKVPLTPEVARNGNIPNVWTLDLTLGELKQWTDTATGNVSPVPIRQGTVPKIAFVSSYKDENGIHVITRTKAVATVASSDFGAPGPIIDFQPPLSHTLIPKNIHPKSAFEKMSLEGRPPVSVGVTSGGNLFGGTEVTFGDILGDKLIDVSIAEVSTYRTYSLTYQNQGKRFQYALQGFSQTEFFYSQNTEAALFYDPSLAPFISTSDAQTVLTSRGALIYGIYPFSRYSRLEVFGGYAYSSVKFANAALNQQAVQFQNANGTTSTFYSGAMLPMGVAFVQETTIFREFGPVAGSTMRLSYDGAPPIGTMLSRQTTDGDLRHYMRIGASGLLALRMRGFKSWGSEPELMYFGGNGDLSGYDYLSFVGQKAFFGDAELRFPLIEAMKTPIGILGGVRGKFFFDIGGAGLNGQTFTPFTTKDEVYTPLLGYQYDINNNVLPIYGPPSTVSGFRLRDARASYGFGLETFAIGLPIHVDWAWKTLFNKSWEDLLFASTGGSAAFRKSKLTFWIGYDY